MRVEIIETVEVTVHLRNYGDTPDQGRHYWKIR